MPEQNNYNVKNDYVKNNMGLEAVQARNSGIMD
jgi:hypothetical protein